MTKINHTIEAMTSLRAVNLSLDNTQLAQEIVKAQKADASEKATNWFNQAIDSGMNLERIASSLTQAGQAMRLAGEFGSDEQKVKKGSRKSVASHNHERAMRFFTRTWKAVYSETYDVELSGSTILIFKELKVKAVKTWRDTINDSLKEQGLLSPAIDKIIEACTRAITVQELELKELVENAQLSKNALEVEQDGLRELAAAKALAEMVGITVEQALQEISERRAKQA